MKKAPPIVVPVPKPAELADIRAGRCAVIEASAGTGKTYTLEHLVVDLVLDGVPMDAILVVTFTEKATAELVKRVRAKLVEILARTATPPEGGMPGGPVWLVDERARGRLRDALAALDRATIATIHGFCQRVLTEHAFAHGRLLQQELADGKSLFSAAFRESLRRDLAPDAVRRRWLAAWLEDGRPLDDLEALLYEAAGVAAGGCPIGPRLDAERLTAAAIAFGRAAPAPGPLREALAAAKLGRKAKGIEERLARLAALVADHERRPDPTRLLRAIDAEEKRQRADGLFPYLRTALAPLEAVAGTDAFLRAFAALDAAVVPFAAAVVAQLLPPVRERLARRKRALGLLDFDDLLSLVDESLQGPHGGALVERLRRRYRAALIDEFQDTDDVQWRIFGRLFLERGADAQFFVIGDPKQSIYGFRGADVRTYLRACKAMDAADGRRVSLARNFRSTAAMIEACNAVFSPDGDGAFFKGEIRYDHPSSCGRPERALVDDGGAAGPPLVLLSIEAEAGKALRMREAKTALAAWIAAEIERLLARPPLFTGGPGEAPRPLRAGDVFVLTRSGPEAEEIGEALRRRRVPHAHYKQDGLFQTAEADQIQDLLVAIDDPGNAPARLRAFLTPFFAVTLEELGAMGEIDAGHPLVTRLVEWKGIAEQRDYERLFARILDDSGLLRRQLFLGESERAVVNVQHIFELLLAEVARARLDLGELCGRLAEFRAGRRLPAGFDANVQRLETERQAVQIMTMHKSKGLEAGVVFLFGGFSRGSGRGAIVVHHARGPREACVGRPREEEVRAALEREQAEEDERLLYVALTRAKGRLYLPVFPGGEAGENKGPGGLRVDGSYRLLDRRLQALMRTPAFAPLHRLERVPCGGDAPSAAAPAADPAAPLAWSPPRALLAPPAPAPLAELRRAHAGKVSTSYSQLKALTGGFTPPPAALAPELDELAEPVLVTRKPAPGGDGEAAPARPDEEPAPDAAPEGAGEEDDLPGGPGVGVFLHELLEEVPLPPLAAAPPQEEWAARPDVRAFFDARFRDAVVDPRHRPACERLVHGALTTPLPIPGGALPGLATLAHPPLRELELLFPAAPEAPGGASPGFVKGIVDALCQHDGRLYAIDWKSDRLPPGLDAAGLGQHVDRNYDLQARLYTLGLVRALRATSEEAYELTFGGLLYVFLRRRPLARGVFFLRPTWAELGAWERALAVDPRWRRLTEL